MHVQDGVVLGADTRSTSGSTVADKNCEKIHYIAPNIYCCGAGTAADTENVTGASNRQHTTSSIKWLVSLYPHGNMHP
jgi:20S proteasome alpha/beta subunit